MRSMSLPALVAAIIVGAWGVTHGDVPKPEDMAACNKEAQEAVNAGSASPKTVAPTTKDAHRAAEARRGAGAEPADAATRSDDPQLEGIDAEGAKDPVYQAAFRTCMRKSGF